MASLSAAVAATLAACVGEPVSGEPGALTEGTPDDGDPAIVAVVGAPLGCTGTLVDPRVVLTAAHCGAESDPGAVEVVFGADVASGERRAVLTAVPHPGADDTADRDLALLLLRDPAPAEIAPVPLASEGSVAATPPVSVRLVGFGVTAAGAGDDGDKREGTSVTTDATPDYVSLGADPSLPCNGDSGGPVLVEEGGREVVGAVISRGDAACDTEAKATRVDTHLDFVAAQLDAWSGGAIAGDIGAGCSADDECLSHDCVESRSICSVRCVSESRDCPGGFVCDHLGGVDFYCVRAPPDDSGCGASRARAEPPFAIALAALYLWRRRRSLTSRGADSRSTCRSCTRGCRRCRRARR